MGGVSDASGECAPLPAGAVRATAGSPAAVWPAAAAACRCRHLSHSPLTHRIAVMEKNGIEQLLRAEDEAAAIVQKARESTNQRAGHREAGAVAAGGPAAAHVATGEWPPTPTSPAHSTPLWPLRHLGSNAAVRWDRGDDAAVHAVVATMQSRPPFHPPRGRSPHVDARFSSFAAVLTRVPIPCICLCVVQSASSAFARRRRRPRRRSAT